MKKIKGFVNKNYKVVIGIIIGITISIGIGVSAVATKDITYDNSTSGLTSTNLQGAIDELNTKATTKIEEAKKECPTGYNCNRNGSCSVLKGTGLDIGDEINCSGDDFYVIETSDDHLSLLTKYPVLSDGTGQSTECIGTAFSSTEHVGDYDKCARSVSVNTYINTLFNNTTGVSGSTAISVNQLNNLGCSITVGGEYQTASGTCKNSGKKWLYSFTYHIEKTSWNSGVHNYIYTGGYVGYDAVSLPHRPVINIPVTFLSS